MEIQEIKKSTFTKIVLQSLRMCYVRFALFITFMTYVLLGNDIKIQQVNLIKYMCIIGISMLLLNVYTIQLFPN